VGEIAVRQAVNTANASPAAVRTARAHHWAKPLALCFATVALWLALVELPGPAGNGLDAAWNTSLIDSHIHQRQFGTDVIFTYGPWGYLNLVGYLPEALPAKFIWELAGKLALSVTAVRLSGALVGVRRWLFVGALCACAHYFDNVAAVLLVLLPLVWLVPARAAAWQRLLAIAWLAFLAHFKFVLCLQATASIAIICVLRLAEGKWRHALTVAGGFTAAYVAGWLAAGQSLANLQDFWRQSAEISRGYSWAMNVDPPPLVLGLAAAVVALGGAFLWMIWRSERTAAERAGAILIVIVSGFAAWKQGFTRADEHTFGFFLFCLLLGIALPGLFAPRRVFHWRDLNVLACLAGIGATNIGLLTFGPAATWSHWRHYPRELTHLDAWRARFDAALARQKAAARDATLQAIAGRGTVDLLNFEQGVLFLNDLTYHPRPVIQSYSAYTTALAHANARFFRSDRAPDFVVLRLNTIDGRYPAQDDAPALVEILRTYELAHADANSVIVRRKSARPTSTEPARAPLASHVPHWGDPIQIPDGHGHPVWLEIDFRPTLLGRLRAFLYHAALPRMIAMFEDGQQKEFRLVSTTSSDGFLLQPLVEGPNDFAALLKGRGFNWPTVVQLELDDPRETWFWKRPRVRFSALTEFPVARSDPLDIYVDTRAVNVRPLSVRSGLAVSSTSSQGHPVIFAHVPSEIVLPAEDARELSGGCGFMEGAYLQGKTDGADFTVEALLGDGSEKLVWQRTLDPIARPADRGFQSFHVTLPAGTARVRLRIGPGASGRSDWDWTYWGELVVRR
jgi:hypothetical protein